MTHETRFAICEAYYVYAGNVGDYATIARLDHLGYRPGLSARNGRIAREDWQARDILARLYRKSRATR